MTVTEEVAQSAVVTTEPEKPQPEWQMRLYGVPCEYCWTPAKALVVFADYRYVIHEDPKFKPCVASNPKATPLGPALSPWRKPSTVKRKVGRPPVTGKYTREK